MSTKAGRLLSKARNAKTDEQVSNVFRALNRSTDITGEEESEIRRTAVAKREELEQARIEAGRAVACRLQDEIRERNRQEWWRR